MTDEYVQFEFPMPAELQAATHKPVEAAPIAGAIIAQLAVREYELRQQLKRNHDAQYNEYLQSQAAEVSELLRKLKYCSLPVQL